MQKGYKVLLLFLCMDLNEIVHVSTTKEKNTKKIALELANDTGRKILEEIYDSKRITASEIAENLQIPLPTVLFHTERLTELNLVKVADTKLSKKFREIKYYSPAKKAILIIPAQKEEAILSIKNALQTRIVAPLSLLIALGITVTIGWFTQREGSFIQRGIELEKAAAPLDVPVPEAANALEANTFHYFLLGSVVLCIVFVCIYILARIIQKRALLSK